MTWKPTNNRKNKKKVVRIVALVTLLIALVATGTFYTLSHLKVGQDTTQTQNKEKTTRSFEEIKESAFTKLKTGNQADGIKEFEAGLAQAKTDGNASEVLYFEQQIDYAKNTKPTAPASTIFPQYSDIKDPNRIEVSE